MPTLRELFEKIDALEGRIEAVEEQNQSLWEPYFYGDRIPTPEELNPDIGTKNTDKYSVFDFREGSQTDK